MDEKDLQLQELRKELEKTVFSLKIEIKELKEQNSLLQEEYEALLASFKSNEQLRG